jgi:hypothetical protein
MKPVLGQIRIVVLSEQVPESLICGLFVHYLLPFDQSQTAVPELLQAQE